MSVEDLHKAIGSARANYKVKRWIIKGIPPVYDHIQASLDVSQIGKVGEVIQGLIRLQTAERQIGIDVFPYGIPVVDGVLIGVDINVSTGPGPVEAGG
jgi:hypothetical protein